MSIFNNNYKRQGKIGLFDNQEASERLSRIGHPLEKIKAVIDFDHAVATKSIFPNFFRVKNKKKL